jgi:hypothetical protein
MHTHSTYEVDANGGDVALGISVIREPQQETRLAHAGVSNQQQLKQEVAANIHEYILLEAHIFQ